MLEGIRTLDDVDVRGKTVILRVDINSPVDRETRGFRDDTRLQGSAPTIRELSEKGAKTVILAHQADPLDYENFTLLEEHSRILEEILGRKVDYISDCAGPAALEAVKKLRRGEILLLENIRIHTEETVIFEKEVGLCPAEQAKTFLVSRLAPLSDFYVCDAFACVHRSEPSLVGFPELLPSACGRLFEEELRALSKVVKNPDRPSVFILGGAKILDAFKMMRRVLEEGSADRVLTSGVAGEIMLRAAGYFLGEKTEEFIEKKNLSCFVGEGKEILEKFTDRMEYPEDVVFEGGDRRNIREGFDGMGSMAVDIGGETLERYKKIISDAGTIFMNGPAGVYEKEESSAGTGGIFRAVADSKAFSVIGGGDTIAAAKAFGLLEKYSYVSTAGGGLVRYISGENLPVIEALRKNSRKEQFSID